MIITKEQIKATWTKAKTKVVTDTNKVVAFVKDNPETVATIAGLGTAAYGAARRRYGAIEAKQLNRRVWDASTGTWYITRKDMTNGQKLEFERRKRNGEATGQILASMNLL